MKKIISFLLMLLLISQNFNLTYWEWDSDSHPWVETQWLKNIDDLENTKASFLVEWLDKNYLASYNSSWKQQNI